MKPADGPDAVFGCLLGGAIGDAVGGVGERGRLGLSDDTQLTLATCEGICEAGRVKAYALAAAWYMAEVSFQAGLDELVRIGGDTDTIASIAGQVAGARLGVSRLPLDLLSLVPERELIEDVGRRFSIIAAKE